MPKDFTEDSEHGPLSVLVSAIKTNSQVLINCRNNRKLLGRVKAFDRHLNLLLENVKEVWTDRNSQKESKTPPSNKDRFISKLFLRGDSIILVLKNPKWVPYDYESRTYIFFWKDFPYSSRTLVSAEAWSTELQKQIIKKWTHGICMVTKCTCVSTRICIA